MHSARQIRKGSAGAIIRSFHFPMWSSVYPVIGFLVALLLISCQPPPSSSSQSESPSPSVSRDLSQDEAAGGHVLRKHVGQTDAQLRQRLQEEPNISGASTYTDRATAEKAIGAAIAQSQERIQRWLDRSGRHTNLVLDYDSPGPIGRTLKRGESQPRSCSHALVVLKYDALASYHVLTSYPECQ
jgi:toxin YxiD